MIIRIEQLRKAAYVALLVPLRAVSDPFRWSLPRVESAILQGEATEGGQSTEARAVYNKKSSKIQRKALQYAIL
jgi:hypothetical protein